MTKILPCLLASTALCGLSFAQSGPAKSPSRSGIDLSAIDKSVNPCEDFYHYACGSWIKKHPIPSDESRYGRFNELLDRNQAALREIAEDAAQHQTRSPLDQKIGAFYQSCMDVAAIDKRGTSPLQSELERISHLSDNSDLLGEIARLHKRQIDVFFAFDTTPDPKNASVDIAEIDQGGLGLPEKDFYFRTDPRSEEIRKKYVAHIAKMFELTGVAQAEAEKKAATVMSIETDLAKASLDVTSRRDPQLLVHEYSKDQLKTLSPAFDFNRFFTELDTPAFSKLNVAVPDFVKALNAELTKASFADLKDYLTWHYIDSSATLLPQAFVDEHFDFYGRTLTGQKEIKPRWKRCIQATDDELGEALGRKFVEKTFGAEGKQRTLELVGEIEREMASDIDSLPWMSNTTKKEAMVKLHAVMNKIGYPDKWRDYSSLNVVDGDYLGDFYRANEFESKRQRDKIGKPVDRTEWGMTPPTVNAYYNPQENNINFPAGILQPPFYSNQASDAVNYGAIGVVIGHELTHGFDDEGRQFDADGNLKDWWQKADAERFEKLADCFVKEYGGFSPAAGVKLNGKLTLGENSADNGGLRLAYIALINHLSKTGTPVTEKLDGYTEAQQYFLGFGQVWCENHTEEAARLHAQTDPHSPPEFRVNGAVSNFSEFSKAFNCKAGDKMYVERACRVW